MYSKLLFISFFLFMCSCNDRKESKVTYSDVDSVSINIMHYMKKFNEATWLYYESNFRCDSIYCAHDSIRYNRNLCFSLDGLEYDFNFYGDTFEITIFSHYIDKKRCLPICNGFYNIFGFFPNTDTVVYRSFIGVDYNRIPEVDSLVAKYEWDGILPRFKQKRLFREFILENKDKINPWLKCEAIKRGYISE